jgi:hypothetical protein
VQGRRTLFGAVVAAGLAITAPVAAAECAPVRIALKSVPEPWRHALEELALATKREGQPWSCSDARVSLVPPRHGGLPQLQVEDAAGVHRRPVASPADVVALGEAMLARTFTLDEPSNPPPPPLPPAPIADAPSVVPAKHGPELLVDVLVGSHFTGPTYAMLLGPELRTTLMLGPWSAGLVAKYDTAIAYLQNVPPQFFLSSLTVGLAGGYRLLAAPVELQLAIEPTLAVVLLGGQGAGESEPDIDAHVDMRLGARLAAAVPVTERLRAACALRGEGAPAALFSDRSSRHHTLPAIPGYLIGLSCGIEVLAIR